MDLARALAGEPPIRWIVGRVTALTGATFTMTYRGGDVTGVGTVDQYVPVVGDIVHVLASNANGFLAIGSNNQVTAPADPVVPGAPILVPATATATFRVSTATWTPAVLVESPDQVGCWLYSAPLTASPATPASRLTIRVTTTDPAPLEFVLHRNVDPTGPLVVVSDRYRVAPSPVGVPTDVALPLGWAPLLIGGGAAGVGVGSGDYTTTLTGSSGLLTFTPLT